MPTEDQRSALSVAAACEVFLAMIPANARLQALSSAAEEVCRELVAYAISSLEDASLLDVAYEQLGVEFDRVRQLYPKLEDSLEIWAAYIAHMAVNHVRGGFQDEELIWEQLVHYVEAIESDTGFDGLTSRFRNELAMLRGTVDSIKIDAAGFEVFRQSARAAMGAFVPAVDEMDSIFADLMIDGG